MDDNVVTVKVTDDQEFVAREMQRYDFTAMPVVDNEGMFVGIITIDDAIDVLTDERAPRICRRSALFYPSGGCHHLLRHQRLDPRQAVICTQFSGHWIKMNN